MSAIPFISYSNTDWDAAVELRELLRAAGIECHPLRLRHRWVSGLQQVLTECTAFVVLVGRDGVQRWVGAECEVALNRHLSAMGEGQRLPIHPVLLPGATPDSLPPLLALFQAEQWRPGSPLPAGLREALPNSAQRLQRSARFEGCPFRGLGTFQQRHAALFFGRQAETLQAVAGLGDQRQADPVALAGPGNGSYFRWLQVEGNSGSGKSSLVQAGLLPMVDSGALWARTGLANWRVLGPMVPGREPLTNLAEALEQGLNAARQPLRDIQMRRQRLLADPRALEFAVRDARAPDTGFLLVIDQFEELYTLADEGERLTFDALLATALAEPDCPLFIVTTVRADFLDRIEQLPRLSAIYNARCKRLYLPTIGSEGLRDAIERPAQLAGIDVSEVSTAMQEQARDEPGALPLVENALLQLWEVRQGDKLSGAEFRARGGLTGMLSAGADALLARIEAALPKHGRTAALELLLCLTRVSPDGRHTRRRVSRAEAIQAAGNGNAALGEHVLQMLSGERAADRPAGADANIGSLRLVTTGVEAGEPYADLIHETLLRSRGAAGVGNAPQPYWPTLQGYIEANRDRDMVRQQLSLLAQRWRRAPRYSRWLRLAGWLRQLEFRGLRLAQGSTEARYLSHSRTASVITAAVVSAAIGPFAAAAVWAGAYRLPVAYVFAAPLWYVGLAVPLPEAVELPPGRRMLGCMVGRDVDQGQECPADTPRREVNMARPCAMGVTEVTFWQYDYYIWSTETPAEGRKLYPSDGGGGREKQPVVYVSWHEAQAYARWLSRRSGQVWRLPTNDEWEYAARGGLEARYPWGDAPPAGRANCGDCGDRYSDREAAPVGSYAPNGYGLHDMAGNVSEWVEDGWHAGGNLRVVRGGGFAETSAPHMRAIEDMRWDQDRRAGDVGFRVCRVSP